MKTEMAEKKENRGKAEATACLKKIAMGRVNDAVKLAFLDGTDLGAVDRLDLTAVAEFKRSSGGAVEVKLLDRLEALEKWMEWCRREEESRTGNHMLADMYPDEFGNAGEAR